MVREKVLLPYNFSRYDRKALDFVIDTFSRLKEIQVTLFHAYTPLPEIDMNNSPVMSKLKENMRFLSQKIQDQEEALRSAKDDLVQGGFSDGQIRHVFRPRKKDIAGEIVDLATSEGFKVIVMNHRPGKVTRFFTGSIFNKVVSSLKDTTICLVT